MASEIQALNLIRRNDFSIEKSKTDTTHCIFGAEESMLASTQLPRRRAARRKSSRQNISRVTVACLIILSWGWVALFFGLLFYRTHVHEVHNHKAHITLKSIQQKLDSTPTIRDDQVAQSPLLIFTCRRDNYLNETMADILHYIPDDCSIGCPIVVSQDGTVPKVEEVIEKYAKLFAAKNIPLIHLRHQSSLRGNSYNKLAEHYGWALRKVFANETESASLVYPRRVIILEEDIHIAPDFFSFFAVMAPILDKDSTLLAISAFNDNGFESKVLNDTRVLRSDFFPGLGWMMTRRLWDSELFSKWPNGYWDDWLREPDQRKGRHILRPEVSRTFHFGVKGGASGNQFGSRLGRVKLNSNPINWLDMGGMLEQELSHETFNANYLKVIRGCKKAGTIQEALEVARSEDVRIEYETWGQFQQYTRRLELMDDEKAGIPRTGYKGVVETRPYGQYTLFVAPPFANLELDLTNPVGSP